MDEPNNPTRTNLLIAGGLILVLILFCGGFALCTGGAAIFGVQQVEPVRLAMVQIESEPDIIEAIGEPIELGFGFGGSISVSGPTGEADISVPIQGTSGSGHAFIVATKSMGKWTIQALEVEIKGKTERIVLIPQSDTNAPVEVILSEEQGLPNQPDIIQN